MVERHYFRGKVIRSYDFKFGFVIPNSSNSWEFMYELPELSAEEEQEIIDANKILKSGNATYNLMHCVSSYPCNPETANIGRINWLKELHDNVGYSDHTGSIIIPASAVVLGASVIEKHFTTDKSLPGRDNKFALDPNEFKLMSSNIREVELAMNDLGIDYQDIESDTVNNYRGRWEPHDYE